MIEKVGVHKYLLGSGSCVAAKLETSTKAAAKHTIIWAQLKWLVLAYTSKWYLQTLLQRENVSNIYDWCLCK